MAAKGGAARSKGEALRRQVRVRTPREEAGRKGDYSLLLQPGRKAGKRPASPPGTLVVVVDLAEVHRDDGGGRWLSSRPCQRP